MKTTVRTDKKSLGFETRAIHVGSEPDPKTGSVAPPVYQTSTYAQDEVGVHKGYEYARTHNDTRDRLESNLAALEGGAHGVAFSSGLGSTNALMQLFRSGDHVIAGSDLYGGTYRLFERVYAKFGLEFTYLDEIDEASLTRSIRPETKAIFFETPTNPLMKLTDIALVAKVAKEHNVLTVVDNTYASPYFQRPIEHGIDVVLHSTTKYLNGHSDVIGGAVVTTDDDLAERLRFLQNAVGSVPGPWDCWLTLRGIKTLPLRMDRHDQNGRRLAAFLEAHPKVRKVFYPGLASHPQHELARRQMSGFGGMIALELGSFESANRFLSALEVFTLAESLGGIESLASHPASMTHAAMPKEERESRGFSDGLARLSVGCEAYEDLEADLDQALDRL